MNSLTNHTIFITGAAGYVGAMLADQFSNRPSVVNIICLDKNPQPELLKSNKKIKWIRANIADDSWQKEVAECKPTVIIHCAWQIREMYGQKRKQWQWNVVGSEKVAALALSTSSVERFIHFSTASIYGAYLSNTLSHFFKESEPMREEEYLYGIEKKQAEENLTQLLRERKGKGERVPDVFIVRPAAITGPRGRSMSGRFGLQSALSGKLKGSLVYSFVRLMVSFVPATPLWCRQFVHEDDVVDIVTQLSFSENLPHFEIFNLTPSGPVVRPADMAKAVNKKFVIVPPSVVRVAFFFFWHLTRGKIPTSRGGWKFYSYPVVMDGTKVTTLLGYAYRFESKEAFSEHKGRYAERYGT